MQMEHHFFLDMLTNDMPTSHTFYLRAGASKSFAVVCGLIFIACSSPKTHVESFHLQIELQNRL